MAQYVLARNVSICLAILLSLKTGFAQDAPPGIPHASATKSEPGSYKKDVAAVTGGLIRTHQQIFSGAAEIYVDISETHDNMPQGRSEVRYFIAFDHRQSVYRFERWTEPPDREPNVLAMIRLPDKVFLRTNKSIAIHLPTTKAEETVRAWDYKVLGFNVGLPPSAEKFESIIDAMNNKMRVVDFRKEGDLATVVVKAGDMFDELTFDTARGNWPVKMVKKRDISAVAQPISYEYAQPYASSKMTLKSLGESWVPETFQGVQLIDSDMGRRTRITVVRLSWKYVNRDWNPGLFTLESLRDDGVELIVDAQGSTLQTIERRPRQP